LWLTDSTWLAFLGTARRRSESKTMLLTLAHRLQRPPPVESEVATSPKSSPPAVVGP
jgi:hypothetical protein